MNLLQRIYKTIAYKIDKFVRWYYYNFLLGDDPNQEPIDKLKWVPHNLASKGYHLFGPADTIEFAVDRMPVKEEIIFEVETIAQANKIINNLKEVETPCVHQI